MSHRNENKHPKLRAFVTFVLCLVLLAAGIGVARYFINSKVQPKRAPKKTVARLVQVMQPEPGNKPMRLEAMGTVVPAKEVVLRPEVSGTVENISDHLTPGGRVQAGDLLVKLDPRQYSLEVTKAQVAVQSAEADLALELGQQVIAREELKMLASQEKGEKLDTDLALRKPQLMQAQASLESAKADLAQAELDLERTELRAPFNAIVTTLDINAGSQVSTSTDLATLVGTDEYWIEAALPLDVLSHLEFDREGGVPVTVRSQTGANGWHGRLQRLSGTLNDETRMAKGIVVVDSPLDSKTNAGKPLILGEYVSLEIETQPLQNVFTLPRSALREGDQLWLVQDNKLAVKKVQPAGKDSEHVFIPYGENGLEKGASVVVSEITSPIPGMALRIEGEEPATAEDAGKGNEKRAEAENANKRVMQ